MQIGQMTERSVTSLSLAKFGKINLPRKSQEQRAALASELRHEIAPAMRQRFATQRTMQTDLHVHPSRNNSSFSPSEIFSRASSSGVGTLVLANNQVRNVFADMRQATKFDIDLTFGAVMLPFRLKKDLEIQTKVYYNPFDSKIADLVADHRQHKNEIMCGAAIERTLQRFSKRGCWIVLSYPGKLLSYGLDTDSFLDGLKELSKKELLHGLETHHSGHTLWQRNFFTQAAFKASLWEDGGSDFPGFHVGDFVDLGTGMWNVDLPYNIVEEVRRFLTAPLLAKADDYARNGQSNKAFHQLWKALMINPYDFSAYKRAARILEN